ncbi:hypothetical protein H0H81_004136 [Sphagnurus paluster]|uniref:BTB domain-containing protein n=1 Tax=Sphagnurus paluster TaxID=117069 RepID=A0A9P7K5Y1_9AGAR|nr:hypothetical protein H0H81_004136 [Sphagnurus paluster]
MFLDPTEMLAISTPLPPSPNLSDTPAILPQEARVAEPPTPQFERDPKYYLEFVTLVVEDGLYMVPKYQFIKSTDRCDEIFPSHVEEESPVVLKDVKRADFEALLKLIGFATPHSISQEGWVSILKLTSRWAMYKLRELAIDSLSCSPWTVKIKLAREYGILKCLRDGYHHFATQSQPITIDEAKDLGLEATLKLVGIRERFPRAKHEVVSHGAALEGPVQTIVDEQFSLELEESRSCKMNIVEKFLLAKQYGVTEWLRLAYVDLTARQEGISLEEGRLLGLSTTIKVCSARENLLQKGYHRGYYSADRRVCVNSQFKEEFDYVRLTEEQYGPPKPAAPVILGPEYTQDLQVESGSKVGGGARKKKKKISPANL